MDVQGRFRDVAEENDRLRKELAACTTDRSTLADKYQTLAGDPDSASVRQNLPEARHSGR